MTDAAKLAERVEANCPDCHGSGWRWRTPDGFNPFLAGGFATARAMYRVQCNHRRFPPNGAHAAGAGE